MHGRTDLCCTAGSPNSAKGSREYDWVLWNQLRIVALMVVGDGVFFLVQKDFVLVLSSSRPSLQRHSLRSRSWLSTQLNS